MRIKKNQINKGIIESKDIELDVTIKEAKPITEKEKDALFSYESAMCKIIIQTLENGQIKKGSGTGFFVK